MHNEFLRAKQEVGERKKDAQHLSVSAANEEMLNKAAENTPTATWGPANVYTSAY